MARMLLEGRELRKIVGLLAEEIVTVQRDGGRSDVYDVTFGPGDRTITGGRLRNFGRNDPFVIDPQLEEELGIAAKKYTSVAYHVVHQEILSLRNRGVRLRQKPESAQSIVKELNENWGSMLSWPVKGSVGRGELALHLAFASTMSGEPDFVSQDGSIKLSVKYFGSGKTARFKEGKHQTILDMNRAKRLLDLEESKSYQATEINAKLERLRRQIAGARGEFSGAKAQRDLRLAQELEDRLAEINFLLTSVLHDSVNEGGATSGLLAVRDGSVEHIPNGDAGLDRLRIVALKDDRLELCLPECTKETVQFEKVMEHPRTERRVAPPAEEPAAYRVRKNREMNIRNS